MNYLQVLALSELPEQGFKAVDVNGTSVLVGRIKGQPFACVDRCPHAGAPLRVGKLRGDELTCARHGWTFDVLTGEAVPSHPAFHLMQCPVKIEGSKVLIIPPTKLSRGFPS